MSAFIGSGIGYRSAYRGALLEGEHDGRPELLEVIAGHFFASAGLLEQLAASYPLVFHEVGLSVGTAEAGAIDRGIAARVRHLVERARPVLLSDHLAMTRSGGVDLGHLCPLWYTFETLARTVDRVRAWQDLFGVPVALENIAAPFVIPDADMSEAEFFTRLVDATGCGMLMDVTNLALNANNDKADPFLRLSEYPLESVWQVHLAGGIREGDWHVDSHSEPVDALSFRLLAALRARAPLRAIVVERDDKLPALAELVAESRHARKVWMEA